MRLLCHEVYGEPSVGALVDGVVVDLNACLARSGGGPCAMSPRLRDVGDVFRLASLLHRLGGTGGDGAPGARHLVERLLQTPGDALGPDEITVLTPVITPGKVIGVGLNFHSYVAQIGVAEPKYPVLFHKTASALLPSGRPVVIPDSTQQAVVEGEVAVVIGRRARAVPVDVALDYVGGFACANDISARNLEFQTSQLTPGKMIESFCPLGPELVTPDEIESIDELEIRTRINGSLVQQGRLGGQIFSISRLISHISRLVALEIGDVILTGTPNDLGHGDHPTFLRDGDVVSVSIEGVGRLENPVTAAG
jgi:2-keto-4-pentenoate hydratase/2-oxohepta-3-ene-1,7-dioic acid hydratase in catechol pathway